MAITFALVEATPYRLRYLATHDGAAGNSATIPNAAGATPDLRTDAPVGQPIRAITSAAAASQAVARNLFEGIQAGATGIAAVYRAHLTTQLRSEATVVQWLATANSAGGFPVIDVATDSSVASTCYIDLALSDVSA